MNRFQTAMLVLIAFLTVTGCNREERGPVLAGGREVKSWLTDLHNPKAQVRRTAVLKLGNVGDSDPSAAGGLAEALRDSDSVVRRDAVSAIAKLTQPSEEIMTRLKEMTDKDSDAARSRFCEAGDRTFRQGPVTLDRARRLAGFRALVQQQEVQPCRRIHVGCFSGAACRPRAS